MSGPSDAKGQRRGRGGTARAERATVRAYSAERPTIRRDVSWDVDDPTSEQDVVPFTRESVPHVVLSADEVLRLRVDARAGFVLSLIDGRTSVDAIADITNLDDEDLLRVLDALRELGAIAHRPKKIT